MSLEEDVTLMEDAYEDEIYEDEVEEEAAAENPPRDDLDSKTDELVEQALDGNGVPAEDFTPVRSTTARRVTAAVAVAARALDDTDDDITPKHGTGDGDGACADALPGEDDAEHADLADSGDANREPEAAEHTPRPASGVADSPGTAPVPSGTPAEGTPVPTPVKTKQEILSARRAALLKKALAAGGGVVKRSPAAPVRAKAASQGMSTPPAAAAPKPAAVGTPASAPAPAASSAAAEEKASLPRPKPKPVLKLRQELAAERAVEEEPAAPSPPEEPVRAQANSAVLARVVRGMKSTNRRHETQIATAAGYQALGLAVGSSARPALSLAAVRGGASLKRTALRVADQQRYTTCTAMLQEVARIFGYHISFPKEEEEDEDEGQQGEVKAEVQGAKAVAVEESKAATEPAGGGGGKGAGAATGADENTAEEGGEVKSTAESEAEREPMSASPAPASASDKPAAESAPTQLLTVLKAELEESSEGPIIGVKSPTSRAAGKRKLGTPTPVKGRARTTPVVKVRGAVETEEDAEAEPASLSGVNMAKLGMRSDRLDSPVANAIGTPKAGTPKAVARAARNKGLAALLRAQQIVGSASGRPGPRKRNATAGGIVDVDAEETSAAVGDSAAGHEDVAEDTPIAVPVVMGIGSVGKAERETPTRTPKVQKVRRTGGLAASLNGLLKR